MNHDVFLRNLNLFEIFGRREQLLVYLCLHPLVIFDSLGYFINYVLILYFCNNLRTFVTFVFLLLIKLECFCTAASITETCGTGLFWHGRHISKVVCIYSTLSLYFLCLTWRDWLHLAKWLKHGVFLLLSVFSLLFLSCFFCQEAFVDTIVCTNEWALNKFTSHNVFLWLCIYILYFFAVKWILIWL